MYIIDAFSSKSYFREVQVKVPGPCSRQEMSVPRTKILSVYQWYVPEKQSLVVKEKYLCK